ncbi:MAG: hypothetical protein U5J62_07625 [Desulfurivibrio sp.]|nr:hypothetical protein [Desulfurivibrio sp.]
MTAIRPTTTSRSREAGSSRQTILNVQTKLHNLERDLALVPEDRQ